jgi:hypothetical protein
VTNTLKFVTSKVALALIVATTNVSILPETCLIVGGVERNVVFQRYVVKVNV